MRLAAAGLSGAAARWASCSWPPRPSSSAAIIAIGGGLGDPAVLASDVFSTITLGLVIPLAALVFGTAALGTPIDDGTIVYLLVKPVPRRTVVLAAMLVATAATALLAVAATLLSGFLLLGLSAPGLLVGMAAGGRSWPRCSTSSCSSPSRSFTSRALLVGLGYVLLWEGLVTTSWPGRGSSRSGNTRRRRGRARRDGRERRRGGERRAARCPRPVACHGRRRVPAGGVAPRPVRGRGGRVAARRRTAVARTPRGPRTIRPDARPADPTHEARRPPRPPTA